MVAGKPPDEPVRTGETQIPSPFAFRESVDHASRTPNIIRLHVPSFCEWEEFGSVLKYIRRFQGKKRNTGKSFHR